MRPIVVNTAKVASGLGLLLIVAVLGLVLYLVRSLPTTAGTFEVNGLSGRVEIVRDADAIPHIFATTKLDAQFGLGFVHAQDRLWQMEFQRRIGHGRLSEILGNATLREDRFLRTVGFGRAARAAWDRLPAEAREQVDAYVAGINAFLATHQGSRLPPEFTLLGVKPEPWTGPDVLVWVKMMAWDLSANYSTELLRHDIAARVGVDRMSELLPPYPVDGLNILSPAADLPTVTNRALTPRTSSSPRRDEGAWSAALDRSLPGSAYGLRRLLLGGGGSTEGIGSNNWVVDGTLTASGKPMLANDPHLAAQIPSLWYLAHMTAGDFDVIGATLPGTPAVAIGRNQHIAWGETNMFADVQDLYRERLDPSGKSAEYRGAWEPLRTLTETIAVKGAADVHVEVRISRHGPLVSDPINANNAASANGSTALEPLAFRWTALDDDDQTILAFLRLNEARNWPEFTDALRLFVVPSQNFVYADVDGHIGYYAPGRIPIRGSGDGLMPADGWTGDSEWTGWIPFDELPHVYDPPSHFIVTANNRPVPPSYKYMLGFEYHEPYRAQRITDLLAGRKQLTPDDFAAIQSDTYSLHAQALLPRLLAHVRPDTPADRQAVNLLRDWNMNASATSAPAAIFEAWFLQLAPQLVGSRLGPSVTRAYERRFSFITRFVTNALENSSAFCRSTGAATDAGSASATGDCDRIVTSALHEAVTRLTAQLGPHQANWHWADAHAAVFPHQALDTVPILHSLLSRSMPSQGDWSTVNVGAVDVEHPFDQHDIPGYRQIVDLSATNDSRFLASVGQAGHFLSPHYDDGLQNWHDVKHLPMRMDRRAVERGAIGRLVLTPRSGPR